MVIRLHTGDDGQAHFENLDVPAEEAETVALKPGADMTFCFFAEVATAQARSLHRD